MDDYMDEVPEDDMFAPPEEEFGSDSRRSATGRGGAPDRSDSDADVPSTSHGMARQPAAAGKESDEDVPFMEEEVAADDDVQAADVQVGSSAVGTGSSRIVVDTGMQEDPPFVEEAVADDDDVAVVDAAPASVRRAATPPASGAVSPSSAEVAEEVAEEYKEPEANRVTELEQQLVEPPPAGAGPIEGEQLVGSATPSPNKASSMHSDDIADAPVPGPSQTVTVVAADDENEPLTSSAGGTSAPAGIRTHVEAAEPDGQPEAQREEVAVAVAAAVTDSELLVAETNAESAVAHMHAVSAAGDGDAVADEYGADDDFESAAAALDDPEPFSARTREALEPLKTVSRPKLPLQPEQQVELDAGLAVMSPQADEVHPVIDSLPASTAIQDVAPVEAGSELDRSPEGEFTVTVGNVTVPASSPQLTLDVAAGAEPEEQRAAASARVQPQLELEPERQAASDLNVDSADAEPVSEPDAGHLSTSASISHADTARSTLDAAVEQNGDAIAAASLQILTPEPSLIIPPPAPAPAAFAAAADSRPNATATPGPAASSTSSPTSAPVAWVMDTPARPAQRASPARVELALPLVSPPAHTIAPLDLNSLDSVLQHYARPLHALFLHAAWRNGRPTPPTTTSFETIAMPTLDKGGFIAISLALGLPVPRSTMLDAYVGVQRSHGVQVLTEEQFHIALTRLAMSVTLAAGANVPPPVALHACLHPTCTRASGVEKRVRNGTFGFKSGQRLPSATLWEILEAHHASDERSEPTDSEQQIRVAQRDIINDTTAPAEHIPPQRSVPGGIRSPSRVIVPKVSMPPGVAAVSASVPVASSMAVSAPVSLSTSSHAPVGTMVYAAHALTAPAVILPVQTPAAGADGSGAGWAALALSAGGVTLQVDAGLKATPVQVQVASPVMAFGGGGALAGLDFHALPPTAAVSSLPSAAAVYEFESLLGSGGAAPMAASLASSSSPVRRPGPAPMQSTPTLAQAGVRVIQLLSPHTVASTRQWRGHGGLLQRAGAHGCNRTESSDARHRYGVTVREPTRCWHGPSPTRSLSRLPVHAGRADQQVLTVLVACVQQGVSHCQ